MNIFIVFGSESDQPVYGPLAEQLKLSADVECQVISAHRNLPQLQEALTAFDGDYIIAGAGLAAALPGVAASISDKPVFGVPVAAHYGGLDAVASILQMPYGKPVLTVAPGCEAEIGKFINAPVPDRKRMCIVVNASLAEEDFAIKEIARTLSLAEECDYQVTVHNEPAEDALNVIYTNSKDDMKPDAFAIHVPLIAPDDLKKPETLIEVFNWMQTGGLWMGTNNGRNAVLWADRLFHKEEGKNHDTVTTDLSRLG
jgi:5-(carboxyamino)imidazole ribonucleotide mutase